MRRNAGIEWLYRKARLMYPGPIRQSHGRDMEECFKDLLAHERLRGGSTGVTVVSLRTMLEIPRSALRAHWERLNGWFGKRPPKLNKGQGPQLESWARDVRFAIRSLRKTPGFTVTAVSIIALGIGANSAIFSIVNAVLFKQQPYQNPSELVEIYTTSSDGKIPVTTSYADYLDLRDASGVFADVAAHHLGAVSQSLDGSPEMLVVEWVTANFFTTLGLQPAIGRGFDPITESEIGAIEPVAVLSHSTWQGRFGADPAVVGSVIKLNSRSVTVVGVGPEGFKGATLGLSVDYWLPVAAGPLIEAGGSLMGVGPANLYEDRGTRVLFVKGRLAPDVALARAQAAVDVLASRLARAHPETNEGREMQLFSVGDVRIHPMVDRTLAPVAGLLMGVVGLVLIIACSNLANLLLARGTSRQKEMAIRVSQGATRGRLLRQLLTESVLLSLGGGAAGLLLAFWFARAIAAFRPPLPVPVAIDVSLDGRVLAFTLGLSLVTGVLFGLIPGLRATRPDLVPALKDEAPTLGKTGRRFGLRIALVVSQVAVSLLLLVCAGLFVRSLANSQRLDPGFRTSGLAILKTTVAFANYSPDEGRNFYSEFARRLETLPGVESVALAFRLPLGGMMMTQDVAIEGYSPPTGEEAVNIDYSTVGAGYFETLGVPIIRGRGVLATDGESSPRVAVVSETMARRFWGGLDVVGKEIRLDGAQGPTTEIVGVAATTKVRTLGEGPRPYLYIPFAQSYTPLMSFIIQTASDPAGLLETARRELSDFAPGVVVFESKTIGEHLGLMLFAPRMGAALLSIFGLLAIVLASLGLYGVVSYAAAQRTRELGIRMALGAPPSQVVKMVVWHGMGLVAVGVMVGLPLAALAARPLSSMLLGVGSFDPMAFGGVTALLFVVALMASLLPARRAARMDPLIALRVE